MDPGRPDLDSGPGHLAPPARGPGWCRDGSLRGPGDRRAGRDASPRLRSPEPSQAPPNRGRRCGCATQGTLRPDDPLQCVAPAGGIRPSWSSKQRKEAARGHSSTIYSHSTAGFCTSVLAKSGIGRISNVDGHPGLIYGHVGSVAGEPGAAGSGLEEGGFVS